MRRLIGVLDGAYIYKYVFSPCLSKNVIWTEHGIKCVLFKGNKYIVLSLGLTARQPLWVILCRLPEKERKEIEEIVEETKERNESEETQEVKTFSLYPYLLQG